MMDSTFSDFVPAQTAEAGLMGFSSDMADAPLNLKTTTEPLSFGSLKDALLSQQEHLIALPAGWDGYGAPKLRPDVVRMIVTDLMNSLDRTSSRVPDLIPGADGSVQAEWHLNDLDLAFRREDSGDLYLRAEPVGGALREYFGRQALEALSKWAPRLAAAQVYYALAA